MRLCLLAVLVICLNVASAAIDNYEWKVQSNRTYNSLHFGLKGHSFLFKLLNRPPFTWDWNLTLRMRAQTTPCAKKPCPVDGVYKAWGDWNVCNKVCGGGEQTRGRECVAPQHGGQECSVLGVASETRSCNEHACLIDGQWNPWTEWSVCSRTCGGGTRTSTRTCASVANGGKPCVGETTKTESCSEFPCPVDGKWTAWGEYSECSVTCGGGEKTRTRSCNGPFYGGLGCDGPNSETVPCGTSKCPIDGVFAKWTDWGECTKNCGGGIQERSRQCEGPFFGGRDCEGARVQEQSCNTFRCPIDGIWQEWGRWSGCSKSCGDGYRERTRTCIGPYYGGQDCVGINRESQECNMSPCPVDGFWKTWGAWGACSASCGGGNRRRTRVCEDPKYGGQDCSGPHEETEECNTLPCPIDGVWGEWWPWGECLDGKQVSTRTCEGPQFGGEDCQGPREKEQNC